MSALGRYRDPVDRIWLTAAARIGFRVERSAEVYASTDGRRTITIGAPETLDPDDSLAQLVFHEMCHALVEGPEALDRPDWGLDNTDAYDPNERACLRLTAHLARPWGLGRLLAPTTEYRGFYHELGPDPFAPADDPSVVLARLGAQRARRAPWAPHLDEALRATAAIARAAAPFAEDDDGLPSLWRGGGQGARRHPTGVFEGPAAALGRTCGDCAWRHAARGASRCRQVDEARVEPAWPACDRFEPAAALDCQTCAACCRAAYHSVTISRRDPVRRAHPELVVARDGYLELARDGDRCAALGGGRSPGERYACAIYDDRPRPCREFERAGAHCLEARRRVGLSL